jgi:hypothetical protein
MVFFSARTTTGAAAVNLQTCVTTYCTCVDLHTSSKNAARRGYGAGKALPPTKEEVSLDRFGQEDTEMACGCSEVY